MISNYNEFKEFITTIDKSNKPSLLLHACCAPCSSHTIMVLMEYFDITIFYSNDNIEPIEEYNKRLDEIIKFTNNFNIKVIYDEYNNKDYHNAVKGYEHLGEKSERCYKCYSLRLRKTAIKAKELNFDYFTTTLSISPFKVTRWINEIGYQCQEEFNVKYLFSDFKKEDGYKDSIKLSSEYNLYRQDYCGCMYSKQERIEAIERDKRNKDIKS